ncbi:MAG: hypothetical protein ACRC9L_00530 [Brevinema sp.]
MKKSMLFLMVFVSGVIYSRAGVILPVQRMALATSMLQSADAYDQAGNSKKAVEYRGAALKIYPVGDQAHILARQLGVKLEDDQTFNQFIQQADRAMTNRNYASALSDYLMALEIRQPLEVYQKLIAVYQAMGNGKAAEGLRSIVEFEVNSSSSQMNAPLPSEMRSVVPPIVDDFNDGYQAEAIQDPVYNDSQYQEDDEDALDEDDVLYEEDYEDIDDEDEDISLEEEASYQEEEIISD